MRHLDLFSGIGGFALAAQWVWGKEHDIVEFVEQDKFCQQVLGQHWPTINIHNDICNYSFNGDNVDLITGGFPCQDISIAGKGVGIEGERSGLWTEFKRIIGECRPKFALIENVPALTFRGLDRVLCDLAEIGYDAEWQSISASEVGAWHKRERIWIVAYPNISKTTRHGENSGDISAFTKPKGLNCCGERWWATEPELGRVAHGIPNRVDRLKGLGNSIVPQVAYIIMKQIKTLLDKLE